MEMSRVIQARNSVCHQQEELRGRWEKAQQRRLEERQRQLEELEELHRLEERQPLSIYQHVKMRTLWHELFYFNVGESWGLTSASREFFLNSYSDEEDEPRNRDEELRNLTTEFLKLQNELTQIFLETTRVEDEIDRDEGDFNRNIYGPRDWCATWPSIGDGAVSSGHFSKEPASHCFIFVFSMITNGTK